MNESMQAQVPELGRRWADAELSGDASGRFRVTQIADRQDGHWKLAGRHLSPIAQPTEPARQ